MNTKHAYVRELYYVYSTDFAHEKGIHFRCIEAVIATLAPVCGFREFGVSET